MAFLIYVHSPTVGEFKVDESPFIIQSLKTSFTTSFVYKLNYMNIISAGNLRERAPLTWASSVVVSRVTGHAKSFQ